MTRNRPTRGGNDNDNDNDRSAAESDDLSPAPPPYTPSTADGEVSMGAEAIRDDKSETEQKVEKEHLVQQNLPPARSATAPVLGHYLTEPVTTANLAGIALSPLAAAVLTEEKLISAEDLELISQDSGIRRDPTDPLSAVLFGVYDTVEDIGLGLVAGPVELGRQAGPLLMRHESRQPESHDGDTQPLSASDTKGMPQAAAQVAIGTGKGLGRIVTAGLKTPMVVTHGLARGFHNLPKAYGEEVREYENVTGLKSGLVVSAKSFGYGLGDGLRDLFTKPIEGAEQNGIIGFGTGFAKGIGNVVCKPAAGAVGLVGYSSAGLYKSIRNIGFSKKEDPADLVRKLGESEYQQASVAEKMYIARIWCQTQRPIQLV